MRLILLIVFLISCHINKPEITENELRRHLKRLASDSLQGRKAGTEMELKAASYIGKEYSNIELLFFEENYFQKFEYNSGIIFGENNSVSFLNKKVELYTDYLPLHFSHSKSCTGPIIFGGFGIVADEMKYNNYENLDVNNKIIMVLDGGPESNNPHNNFEKHTDKRTKAIVAREKGAIGIIIINDKLQDENSTFINLKNDKNYLSVGIPAIQISNKIANLILEKTGTNIDIIIDSMSGKNIANTNGFNTGINMEMNLEVNKKFVSSQNVVGYVQGSGTLSNEFIVIGAHYDHLGWGGEGSGSLDPDIHAIHNGADDNASGTSALIELAEYFTNYNNNNKRGIIFISFGGEEEGLLGSSYFTENSPKNLKNIIAMINLDMIGRMEENKLIIGGTGTSPLWVKLLNELNTDSLLLTFDEEGYGASDHQSFYLKNIPVLFFFTGAHKDYHRPTDDINKINFDGLRNISNFIKRVTTKLITLDQKPEFKKAETEQRHIRGFSVYVGTIPDYTYNGKGMRLSGIREKGPGGRAGLKAGDIIIQLGEIEIFSIYDYMYALENVKPRIPVEVEILRNEKTKTIIIIPEEKK